jgi:hypothetical protein
MLDSIAGVDCTHFLGSNSQQLRRWRREQGDKSWHAIGWLHRDSGRFKWRHNRDDQCRGYCAIASTVGNVGVA